MVKTWRSTSEQIVVYFLCIIHIVLHYYEFGDVIYLSARYYFLKPMQTGNFKILVYAPKFCCFWSFHASWTSGDQDYVLKGNCQRLAVKGKRAAYTIQTDVYFTCRPKTEKYPLCSYLPSELLVVRTLTISHLVWDYRNISQSYISSKLCIKNTIPCIIFLFYYSYIINVSTALKIQFCTILFVYRYPYPPIHSTHIALI